MTFTKCLMSASALMLALTSASSWAKEIRSMPEKKAKVNVATITETSVLGANAEKDITVRLITVDHGKSTDLYPRFGLILAYQHPGEMNNVRTAFDLGSFIEVKSAKRTAPGIYEIAVVQMNDEGAIADAVLEINTAKVFEDDRKLKLPEFADVYMNSSINVNLSVNQR